MMSRGPDPAVAERLATVPHIIETGRQLTKTRELKVQRLRVCNQRRIGTIVRMSEG